MEKKQAKLIHEGDYVAEVRITIEQSDGPWAPYVSPVEVGAPDDGHGDWSGGIFASANLQPKLGGGTGKPALDWYVPDEPLTLAAV